GATWCTASLPVTLVLSWQWQLILLSPKSPKRLILARLILNTLLHRVFLCSMWCKFSLLALNFLTQQLQPPLNTANYKERHHEPYFLHRFDPRSNRRACCTRYSRWCLCQFRHRTTNQNCPIPTR